MSVNFDTAPTIFYNTDLNKFARTPSASILRAVWMLI
jgi:hypothetical protein